MKISVIIPAYNVEKYIERSINSALNQKFKPFEIIVVDDGSSDDTGRIVKKFHTDVRYIYQKNGGSSSARNLGIKTSKGDWIAFLDSDDEWVETHLENCYNTISRQPELRWYGAPVNHIDQASGMVLFSYTTEPKKKLNENQFFNDYLSALPPYGFFSSPTMVIKKEIFNEVGLFDVLKKTAEDIDMWFRIGLQYPNIGYNKEVGAIVYKRQDSLSLSKKWQPCHSLQRILSCEVMAKKLGDSYVKRAEPRIIYWVIKLLKAAVVRQDNQTLKEIKKRYYSRLPIKFKAILLVLSSMPVSLKIINRVKS